MLRTASQLWPFFSCAGVFFGGWVSAQPLPYDASTGALQKGQHPFCITAMSQSSSWKKWLHEWHSTTGTCGRGQ